MKGKIIKGFILSKDECYMSILSFQDKYIEIEFSIMFLGQYIAIMEVGTKVTTI